LKRKIEIFLHKTIWLIPIIFMGISFLSTAITWFGYQFNFVVWGNIAGFSLLSNVLFFYVFYFGKYCIFTRLMPVGLFAVNLVNIWGFYNPTHYSVYYEFIVFTVTLATLLIYQFNRQLNK